jgi:UDPglucose--hexose-1-phosphate uridylyltransferase
VRVVPNKFPALSIEGDLEKRGLGVYDRMRGVGAHEVIIETPKHERTLTALPVGRVREVLTIYRDRMADLKRDRRLQYGMLFKNVGKAAGASLEHTHSQLIVTPVVPRTPMQEMAGCKNFYDYRGRCLFCDIAWQETDTEKRVVVSNDAFVAIAPYASRFPFEMWILGRRHESHFEDIREDELDALAPLLRETLGRLERALPGAPYNYIVHTAPFNMPEIEHYHWHIEIIPRLTRVAGFEWGTGFYINPVPPESAAEFLREVEL